MSKMKDVEIEQGDGKGLNEVEAIEEVFEDKDLKKIANVWDRKGMETIPEECL